MPRTCEISGCDSNSPLKTGSFYSLPTWGVGNEHELKCRRRQRWLEVIDIPNPPLSKKIWVCSKHFKSGVPSDLHDINGEDWTPNLLLGKLKIASATDGYMDKIGFGTWQILYTLLTCMVRMSKAMQYINTVFVNRPIEEEDYLYEPQNNSQNSTNSTYYINKHQNFSHQSSETIYECEETSPYIGSFVCGNTFYKEFAPYGDRVWLSLLYQSIFALGCMIGGCLGTTSDMFGRLLVIRVSALTYLVSAFLISFSPYVHLVLFGRFIIGFSDNLILATSTTLLMEITPKKYITPVGLLIIIPFALGAMALAGVAYFVRSWRTLHLICSVPAIFTAIIVIFLRKSPRWLITQGHIEKASDIIVYAAKINKQQLSHKNVLMSLFAESKSKDAKLNGEDSYNESNNSMIHTIRYLASSSFGTPHMLKLSIKIPVIWFITSLVFYGLTLNGSHFTTNIYLYVILTNGFSIIPSLVGSSVISRLGNRYTYLLLSISTGICLLSLLVLPLTLWWLKWTLIILAFMASGLQYDMNFVMANEIFPTVLRTTGCGMSMLASNVGIILSSYLFEAVAHHVWWLPTGVCVIGCIITSCLVLTLPETHGKPLCDTIEQVEKRGCIDVASH